MKAFAALYAPERGTADLVLRDGAPAPLVGAGRARRQTGVLPNALLGGGSRWPFRSFLRRAGLKCSARPPSLTLPHKGGG